MFKVDKGYWLSKTRQSQVPAIYADYWTINIKLESERKKGPHINTFKY